MPEARLILGEATEELPRLPSASVDCVVCDPPYPCIRRSYGTWTEAEWFAMMRRVVPECMRVLKPTGSAVFILQPNSERVGRMRTWLWEFMLWVGKEWGIVQDAWWWNVAALPLGGSNERGTLRASLKACVWIGPADCYRNQADVLWSESLAGATARATQRCGRQTYPSGISTDHKRMNAKAAIRGGVVPFNVLPIPNTNSVSSGGAFGHGAATPKELASWWLRYICPPGGTALDCFSGTGTVGVAALKQGKGYVGIERVPEYHEIAQKRLAEVKDESPLYAEAAP